MTATPATHAALQANYEGSRAAYNARPSSSNPYAVGTPEHAAWDAGWVARDAEYAR